MILIDGKKFQNVGNPKKGSAEHLIKTKLAELKERNAFPLHFKLPKTRITVHKETGLIEFPGKHQMVSRVTYKGPDGSQDIIYCERYDKNTDGKINFSPAKIEFHKSLSIPEEDWEKAVYLILFSGYVSRGEILLEDLEADNRNLKNVRKQKSTVFGSIFNPEAFGINEKTIIQIATGYGISDSNIDTVQNTLYDLVEADQANTKKGYARFIENLKLGESVFVLANVRVAESEGLIKDFHDLSNTWAYTKDKGDMGASIMRYSNSESKYDELVSFLIEDKEAYKVLCGILGDKVIKPETEEK